MCLVAVRRVHLVGRASELRMMGPRLWVGRWGSGFGVVWRRMA